MFSIILSFRGGDIMYIIRKRSKKDCHHLITYFSNILYQALLNRDQLEFLKNGGTIIEYLELIEAI